MENLGKSIQNLRKRKKLTLRYLAERTDLSISFLSQLENNKTSATLESIKKISETLEVDPSYFFHPHNEQKVIKEDNYTISRENLNNRNLQVNSFIYKDLTSNMKNHLFKPSLVILNPNDDSGNQFSHKGQEFLFVLEGTLTVIIDNEEHNLEKHDSIFLDSTLTHYWLNKTNNPIKFLCISSTR